MISESAAPCLQSEALVTWSLSRGPVLLLYVCLRDSIHSHTEVTFSKRLYSEVLSSPYRASTYGMV